MRSNNSNTCKKISLVLMRFNLFMARIFPHTHNTQINLFIKKILAKSSRAKSALYACVMLSMLVLSSCPADSENEETKKETIPITGELSYYNIRTGTNVYATIAPLWSDRETVDQEVSYTIDPSIPGVVVDSNGTIHIKNASLGSITYRITATGTGEYGSTIESNYFSITLNGTSSELTYKNISCTYSEVDCYETASPDSLLERTNSPEWFKNSDPQPSPPADDAILEYSIIREADSDNTSPDSPPGITINDKGDGKPWGSVIIDETATVASSGTFLVSALWLDKGIPILVISEIVIDIKAKDISGFDFGDGYDAISNYGLNKDTVTPVLSDEMKAVQNENSIEYDISLKNGDMDAEGFVVSISNVGEVSIEITDRAKLTTNDYIYTVSAKGTGNYIGTVTKDIDVKIHILLEQGEYYKLASDGSLLADQTKVWLENGNEMDGTKWSCVEDSNGLVWEIKTDDGGLRDKTLTYRWGGDNSKGGDFYEDWNMLINAAKATNEETFVCGFTDWRVPTKEELYTIRDNDASSAPYIKTDIFPNTVSNLYWSASPDDNNPSAAFTVIFNEKVNKWHSGDRTSRYPVRLVSGTANLIRGLSYGNNNTITTAHGTPSSLEATWDPQGQTASFVIVRVDSTGATLPLPTGISIDSDTGEVSVSATAPVSSSGDYKVIATAAGNYTGTTDATVTIAITNELSLLGFEPYSSLSAIVGSDDTVKISKSSLGASWTSAKAPSKNDGSEVTYTIVLESNGVGSAAVSIDANTGVVTIVKDVAVVGDSGTYTITATAVDGSDFTGSVRENIIRGWHT